MKLQVNLVGVVLCGGRGARMGGVNKGLVEYNHRKLFEFACDNLKAVTDHIVINSNTEQLTYLALGFEVIDDADYLYRGPLAGIYAGLTQARAEYVAFAPCDQGVLPPTVYVSLLKQARESGAAFAVSDGDIHPTCCIVATRLAPELKKALDANQLKLGQWMKSHATAVDFSGIDFANINQLPR